jgi:hypothetical protein
MSEIEEGVCLTCLGTGEVSSERGLARCADCDGSGKIGSVFVRNEQRVREIERRAQKLSGEAQQDTEWMVGELRRTRGALVKVMTAAQDGPEDNELLKRILFEANEALGMYPRASQDP